MSDVANFSIFSLPQYCRKSSEEDRDPRKKAKTMASVARPEGGAPVGPDDADAADQ